MKTQKPTEKQSLNNSDAQHVPQSTVHTWAQSESRHGFCFLLQPHCSMVSVRCFHLTCLFVSFTGPMASLSECTFPHVQVGWAPLHLPGRPAQPLSRTQHLLLNLGWVRQATHQALWCSYQSLAQKPLSFLNSVYLCINWRLGEII